MKFGAQINRIQRTYKDNVGNAISFSQTQDGFLDKIEAQKMDSWLNEADRAL